MKYIIYGNNRVAKDFIYIFKCLDIIKVTDTISDIIETIDNVHVQIIICDFNKTIKEKKLQEFGLKYGKDYFYEEDFFCQLNDISIPKDKRIAIWGTGKMCKLLLQYKLPWKVDIFIDTYKKEEEFNDKIVYFPDEIRNWKELFIIIAVAEDRDIRNRLSEYGLEENVDFFNYIRVLNLPSVLLQKTIFDPSYYDLECNTMQNHLEILPDGNTRSCCTTFVSQGLDNIFDRTSNKLWHSIIHKILCLSTENRTFTFCDKSMCPLFVAKKREDCRSIVWDDKSYKEMEDCPTTLALGYDSSCNLACITCRKELHFAQGKELEMVKKIEDKVLKEYLPYCKFLILAGNGEVFASPSYRTIYESKQCTPQYIRLLSNGILFSPENWEHFKKANDVKVMLTVSVDAASKETYHCIRRGNFDVLKRNMKFASDLRRKGELSYFRMNFVVQKENYNEMIDFVQWGEELGVDEVFFTKILNWGTYSPEEFEQVSMMEKDGITPKRELKKILEHPIMKSDIVDLGTIQFGHKVDEIGIVENYYMWELEKRGGKLFL